MHVIKPTYFTLFPSPLYLSSSSKETKRSIRPKLVLADNARGNKHCYEMWNTQDSDSIFINK